MPKTAYSPTENPSTNSQSIFSIPRIFHRIFHFINAHLLQLKLFSSRKFAVFFAEHLSKVR